MSISIDRWGKDHWSTLGYIECRIVDNMGVLDNRHMRCDAKLHPFFAHFDEPTPPTRLKEGVLVEGHDDWSCAEDMVEAGLLKCNGTGLCPIFTLTTFGKKVAAALRTHKASGGNFGEFSWPVKTAKKKAAKATSASARKSVR